jgi:hypothetical protein
VRLSCGNIFKKRTTPGDNLPVLQLCPLRGIEMVIVKINRKRILFRVFIYACFKKYGKL